jgi:hypothetical protein
VGGFADDACELPQVNALVPTARDQHDRRGERAQGRDDRVGLRALRVIHVCDAINVGDDLEAMLFALMTLGDERAVRATYVLGELAYGAPSPAPIRAV